MKLFTAKNQAATDKGIVVDDMILTKEMPTAAGSKMLEGYMSLFDAQAVTLLREAGYVLAGKADVGEFAFDLMGESSYNGPVVVDGHLQSAAAELVKSGEATAAVVLDVNGAPRRAAAQNGLVSIKPTYGTVSRFGTVPVACSGECVSVMAPTAKECKVLLAALTGHDDKDGTSLSAELCESTKSTPATLKRVALLTSLCKDADAEVQAKLSAARQALTDAGVEVVEVENDIIALARSAWNILMSAELCNNVSRYDGVKYGYRAKSFNGIDELYTNSRTEAFGKLLKCAILFGSETLSTENYMKVYDKALRTRRVIREAFDKLFEGFDAVLMPATSKMAYTVELVEKDPYLCFTENAYTAPASVTGLPAVVAAGVQLMGKPFGENTLFAAAEILAKEGN